MWSGGEIRKSHPLIHYSISLGDNSWFNSFHSWYAIRMIWNISPESQLRLPFFFFSKWEKIIQNTKIKNIKNKRKSHPFIKYSVTLGHNSWFNSDFYTLSDFLLTPDTQYARMGNINTAFSAMIAYLAKCEKTIQNTKINQEKATYSYTIMYL